jgi:hypothetical protein
VIRQEHAAAFLALMATFPQGSPVYDGAVPEPAVGERLPPPYRLVHFQFGTGYDDTGRILVGVEAGTKPLEMRAYVHSVADTARAARTVADQTYSVVHDELLVVDARTTFRIRHEDSQPPDRDTSTGRTVFAGVDVYLLVSMPA